MLASTVLRRRAAVLSRAPVAAVPVRFIQSKHGLRTNPPEIKVETNAIRFAPKSSNFKFSGKVETVTWDPTKGFPAKRDVSHNKNNRTYTVVQRAEGARPKGERKAPLPWLFPNPADSPHFYERNDERAFDPKLTRRPSAVSKLSGYNRPSLYSIIKDNTTIVHRELSKDGRPVTAMLRSISRSVPKTLQDEMRAEIDDEQMDERADRTARQKVMAEQEEKGHKIMGNYVKTELEADAATAFREEYNKRALAQNELGLSGSIVETVAERLPAGDEAGAGAGGAAGANGETTFASTNQRVRTPTSNIVDIKADGSAERAAIAAREPVQLTWKVLRTPLHNLPVYRAHRNGNTRVVTIVRNFRGNMKDLRIAVQSVVGPDVAVVQRLGRIDVLGDHVLRIKTWLATLGF